MFRGPPPPPQSCARSHCRAQWGGRGGVTSQLGPPGRLGCPGHCGAPPRPPTALAFSSRFRTIVNPESRAPKFARPPERTGHATAAQGEQQPPRHTAELGVSDSGGYNGGTRLETGAHGGTNTNQSCQGSPGTWGQGHSPAPGPPAWGWRALYPQFALWGYSAFPSRSGRPSWGRGCDGSSVLPRYSPQTRRIQHAGPPQGQGWAPNTPQQQIWGVWGSPLVSSEQEPPDAPPVLSQPKR